MNFRLIQSNPIQLDGMDSANSEVNRAFFEFQRKNAEAYAAYLASIRHRLPVSAYEFATAEWHYNPNDPKCPHDAWIREVKIREIAEGERAEIRETRVEIILLGAYHDRLLKLTYFGVSSYTLTAARSHPGDWITDEIRLSENGLVVHEIEFWSAANFVIECKDISFEEKLTNTPDSAQW
jgi:hypothetical protein